MFSKLKQIKDLRDQAKVLQDALGQERAESTVNNVTVVMNGNLEVLEVRIPPEMLNADRKDKLQSALKEAYNDTLKKVQKSMAVKMKDMGGLDFLKGLGGSTTDAE